MGLNELMQIPEFEKFRSRRETFDFMDQIVDRHSLPPERWKELLDLTDAVYDGVIHVKDMPELLAQAFGIEGRPLDRVVRELIAVQIAPMKNIVPGLAQQIDEWRALTPRQNDGPQTYHEYAEILIARASISLGLPEVRRLASFVRRYLLGERTRPQSQEFFQRPTVIGGLGLTADQATMLLQFVDEDKGKVQLVDDDVVAAGARDVSALAVGQPEPVPSEAEGADMTNNSAVPTPSLVIPSEAEGSLVVAPSHDVATETPVAAKPPAPSDSLGHSPTGEALGRRLAPSDSPMNGGEKQTNVTPPFMEGLGEAAEIAAHEKKLARMDAARTPPFANGGTGEERMTAAIDAAVNAAAATLAKFRVAKKRFADIARMAIKGVRDPYQTRGIIERDLGITGDAVLELIEAVMLGMETYHQPAGIGKRAVGSAPVPPPLPSETEVLDKRFAAATGVMPKEPALPVMPEARVSAARTKEDELEEQEAKVDAAKIAAAAVASKPEPAKAMLTVGSVPPPPIGEMPMVTDVQFKPRLVGPVEELGTMSPADFRRLSSNADEAARKILDLLHALEATSYEDRIRGVAAWRQSPTNRLYTTMATEALNNGIALAEVASRRRNKGDESLSPAELRAVANINATIRF